MSAESTKTYIGDSVYAEVERGMIKLTTENGLPFDPSNIIYLERETFNALVSWVKRYDETATDDRA